MERIRWNWRKPTGEDARRSTSVSPGHAEWLCLRSLGGHLFPDSFGILTEGGVLGDRRVSASAASGRPRGRSRERQCPVA